VKRAAALLGVLAALAFAGPAVASEQHPTLPEIEGEVLCTVCNEPLDMSSGPFADRERAVIRHWIAAGLTKSQIEDKLVQQFGRNVLLSPPTSGFNVIAWVLPIAGGIAAALVLAFGAWRWSRGRNASEPLEEPPAARIEPDLERRLDEELARYDA
jgi:cytochrome c-type biogenesis protein CcmH/NrfF